MRFNYDGQILIVENYKKIEKLSDTEICLSNIKIAGSFLKIVKLDGYEVWIKGKIDNLEMNLNEIQAKNEKKGLL